MNRPRVVELLRELADELEGYIDEVAMGGRAITHVLKDISSGAYHPPASIQQGLELARDALGGEDLPRA